MVVFASNAMLESLFVEAPDVGAIDRPQRSTSFAFPIISANFTVFHERSCYRETLWRTFDNPESVVSSEVGTHGLAHDVQGASLDIANTVA